MRFVLHSIAVAFLALMSVTDLAAPNPILDSTVDDVDAVLRPFNPRPFAAQWGSSGNSYPIVMVHGLLGWGEKPILGFINYWGGFTSDLVGRLRDSGYTVHVPAMGPASSNWERACELYAQITGARVDYGIARSKRFGHARFGNDYTGRGLFPEFAKSPSNKIHMIGHSMGGPTGRMFIHLMAFGAQEEVDAAKAAGVPVSPFFATDKEESYVSSFASVAGVLRGSTLDDIMYSNGQAVEFTIGLAKALVGVNNLGINIYDFQLGHWGLNPKGDESFEEYITRIYSSWWFTSQSNAMFDLTVAATKGPLLSFVKNSPDTTYFSFTGDATYDAFGNSFAYPDTLPFLKSNVNLLGTYENATLLGPNSREWRPNDGLVSVISTKGDNSGYSDYPVDLKASNRDVARSAKFKTIPAKGRFNHLHVFEDVDHLQIVAPLDLVGGRMDQVFLNVAGLQASLPK
ncbi:hypothetical protein HDU97_006937 [Phlyctochytrium planicorne]|nr:hypothetical protein HDU97_006937 [Phlyctochytrium planicorne]